MATRQTVRFLSRMAAVQKAPSLATAKDRTLTRYDNHHEHAQTRCHSSARPEPSEKTNWQQPKQQDSNEAISVLASHSDNTSGASPTTTVAVSPDVATDFTDNDMETVAFAASNSLTYTGNATMPVTTKLHLVTADEDTPSGVWPVFRLMVRSKAVVQLCLTSLDLSAATPTTLLSFSLHSSISTN